MPSPKNEPVAKAIKDALVSVCVPKSFGEPENVVDAIWDVAKSIRLLGNGDVNGPGGIEAHGMAMIDVGKGIKEGLESISDAISELAAAIRKFKS